ncbi:nmd3, partial [Symbiodinium sp. CCMP2456]
IGKEVRLVDAAFVWTEEHSMRIRVKITVQKEVAQSSVLQQTMVVEFQIVNQQCEDCQ